MRSMGWLVIIAVALTGEMCSSARADETKAAQNSIEGTWTVESVESSGAAIDGLNGAQLVIEGDGKKSFTLPGGVVERGTYTLDTKKSPPQIDSTTDGKEGTQRGIYMVDGDTLKMCLSTQGTRPAKFETAKGGDQLLIVFKRAAGKRPSYPLKGRPRSSPPQAPRTFRMGFTGFIPDTTLEAVTSARRFVREHGDILAHHIEGAPWAEAHSGQPFPKALLDEWTGKKTATPRNGKVYLAISPGRGELKVQDKAGPLPAELKGKEYDDPVVQKAYLAYCRRAIEFFKPDYLAIGIEVNEIHRDGGERKWKAYASLHQHTYQELKKEFPDLPIFASCTLHSLFQSRGAMLKTFQELMPYNDLVAVSYYPFFVPAKDRHSAFDWLMKQFDQFQKPYAVVETNDTAERLPLPQLKLVLDGTPEQQADYYDFLLALAQKRKMAFVISFVHQDYDPLWEKIKGSSPELFKAWRDCGLLDERGTPRPAYQIWKDYLSIPLAETARTD